MREDLFGKKVANLLSTEVDSKVSARLASARTMALAKQKQEVHALSFAGVSSAFSRAFNREASTLKRYLISALLVFGVLGYTYSQNTTYINSIVDVDSQILTDELPLEVYMDTNLKNWLMDDSSDSSDSDNLQ